jgi:hypothetical protein
MLHRDQPVVRLLGQLQHNAALTDTRPIRSYIILDAYHSCLQADTANGRKLGSNGNSMQANDLEYQPEKVLFSGTATKT